MTTIYAERIREFRKDAGLTQVVLASMLNVDRTTLAGYETCRRIPDAETLCMIADVFSVTIDYLLGRE